MLKKTILSKGRLFSLLSFLISLSLIADNAFGQPTNQTFNVSGTYTVPAGYSAIVTIEAWGAGAGGGSGSAESGGGGGGAYARNTTTLASGIYTVTVGTGGVVGTNGGNSSFTTIVIAAGGTSTTTVTGGAGGTIAGSIGTIRFAGSAGGNGGNSNSAGGGGGGSATALANGGAGVTGANGNGAAGGAGGTGQGNGGAGATNTNGASAVAGSAPGGGGGGRASNLTTSAAGANGRVIITVSSVLPVKLSNFKAFEKQTGIQIEWTANGEENLNKYQIERSAERVQFTSIGEVTARNQTTSANYGFFDASPLQGISFYRLRSIDIDNKYSYSNIIKVNLDKSNKELTIFPNPVTDGLISIQSADLSKGNYSVKLFNAAGQEIYSQRLSHSGGVVSQTINLPASVKPGMYNFIISGDNYKVFKMVVVK